MGSHEDFQTRRVRGRPFPKGNGGRPPGSKNKDSLVLATLMDGEREELLRTGIERAKAGNVALLKYFYDRMLPRERLIRIELPKMQFADDAVEALGAITSAVCEGRITPREGEHLATLINSYARAIDIADLARRIDALEAKMVGRA